jgi:hypothetical protein
VLKGNIANCGTETLENTEGAIKKGKFTVTLRRVLFVRKRLLLMILLNVGVKKAQRFG